MEELDAFQKSEETIAIVLLKTKSSRHCGILFKDPEDSNNLKLFHYGFHYDLSISNNFSYYTNALTISPYFFDKASFFSKMLYERFFLYMKHILAIHKENVPYSTINDGRSKLFLNGSIEHSKGIIGFTCSTFWEAFLRSSIGIKLINFGSWQLTDGDKKWRKEVFKDLIDHATRKDDPVITDSIRKTITHDLKASPTPRLKPEEIVGACDFSKNEMPVQYDLCSKFGSQLLEELTAI